jgi:hypothetical protein
VLAFEDDARVDHRRHLERLEEEALRPIFANERLGVGRHVAVDDPLPDAVLEDLPDGPDDLVDRAVRQATAAARVGAGSKCARSIRRCARVSSLAGVSPAGAQAIAYRRNLEYAGQSVREIEPWRA